MVLTADGYKGVFSLLVIGLIAIVGCCVYCAYVGSLNIGSSWANNEKCRRPTSFYIGATQFGLPLLLNSIVAMGFFIYVVVVSGKYYFKKKWNELTGNIPKVNRQKPTKNGYMKLDNNNPQTSYGPSYSVPAYSQMDYNMYTPLISA